MGKDTPYRDDTAHCAAAINCWLYETGYKNINSLSARDIWHRGHEIGIVFSKPKKELTKKLIVVLAYNDSTWRGHVCILEDWRLINGVGYITGFGANQGTVNNPQGEVCSKTYRVGKNEKYSILGFVLPEKK